MVLENLIWLCHSQRCVAKIAENKLLCVTNHLMQHILLYEIFDFSNIFSLLHAT